MRSCPGIGATASQVAHRCVGALQRLRLQGRSRRGLREAAPELGCRAATAKGFGQKTEEAGNQGKAKGRAKKVADASVDGTSRQAVQKAIRAVEKDRKARPVDPREAAKGRLDYVQVKDWGGGAPEDLDAMQVTSFESAGTTGTSQTFYEELARRLGELEKRGALAIAQPKGAPPLPPFERWSFAEMRYVQWLVDMHAVHYTLEAAVADATTVAATEHYSSDSEALRRAFDALARFGEAAGLDRSLEIAADLNSMAKASRLEAPAELEPSANAAAYAGYVARLGLLCTEEDDPVRIEDAALRLLANAYLLHVTHLTTGMRLGAAAAEKLNLFRAQALNFYRTWPDEVLENPLTQCVANVNAAGEQLSDEQREAVMEELPKAMPKIGLLLSTLAHAN